MQLKREKLPRKTDMKHVVPKTLVFLTELHFKFLVLIKAGKDSLLTVALFN